MQKIKHWVHFLPEAETIKKDGDRQISVLQEIKSLLAKVKRLRTFYNAQDNYILVKVSDEWTKEQINEAKSDAYNFNIKRS